MKTSNIARIIIMLLLVFTVTCVAAQMPLPCDGAKIDTAALRKARQFETANKKNGRVQAPRFLIRIFFHIGTDDDGTNAVITPQMLKQEFDTLRADYAAAGICFSFAGYDYMNSTKLNNNFIKNTDDPVLFDPYRQTSCINVFYVQKINGVNTACANNCGIGGTSLSIPSTICLISKPNIGPGRTISHEVGHCMGLLHTFEKSRGLENIDGGNSSSSGDLITDTPADPYVFNGTACFIVSGCTYQGYCTDPNGEKNYIPPYTNLMSYWTSVVNRTCIPALYLTLGQYNRLYSFLSTDAFLLSCGTDYVDYTITAVSKDRGGFFWTAFGTISTSGNVDLSGTLKAAIGAQTIRLHKGFHASVTTGRIIISSTVCK